MQRPAARTATVGNQTASELCDGSADGNGLFPHHSGWTLPQQVAAIRCNPPGNQIGLRLSKLLQVALKFDNPPELIAELGFALSTAPLNYIRVQIDWLRDSGVSEAALRNVMAASRLPRPVKTTIEDQSRTYSERAISCQQKIEQETARQRGAARTTRLAAWRQFTISTPSCLAAAARTWCGSALDFTDETNFEPTHLDTTIIGQACILSIHMGVPYWPAALQKIATLASTHATSVNFIAWAKIFHRMRITVDRAQWHQLISTTITDFASGAYCEQSQVGALRQAWEPAALHAAPPVDVAALFARSL